MQQQPIQNEARPASPDRACCDLLRAVAQPSVADARIRELAQNIRGWDELIRVAKEHRIVPLLFTRLTQAGADLPAEAGKRLQSEYQRNIFHCMANSAELIGLLAAFDEQAIPAMPFKGVVLAASVYGDANARAAGDLDLLVHPRDLPRATQLILQRGYELHTPAADDFTPVVPDYHEFHFERPRDGMIAELRTRLEHFGSRFAHDLGMDWVWPRRRTAILAGATVPNLDPEAALLVLCMHGSKHMWSRLAWIVDVAQLLASLPDLDWKSTFDEARRTGLRRSLALGVLLAHRIADAPVPLAVLRRFESDGSAQRLVRHFEACLFHAPGTTPSSFMTYSMSVLDFRDRLGLLLSLDLLKPNPRDRAFVRLPRWLYPLYYLVRPLRLLFDRSSR